VIRGLSERDYGMDVLIEICGEGRVTGDMIVGQIKAQEKFTIGVTNKRQFNGLRDTTYKYLLGQAAPSYLFVVSLSDKAVYWRSLREHDRCSSDQDAGLPSISMHRCLDLSDAGTIALEHSYELEKRWPGVEHAILDALMFFNALGPLFLACRRLPERFPLPSAVQLLFVNHYEYYGLIRRYVMGQGTTSPLPDFYGMAVNAGEISDKLTFTAGFVTDVFGKFLYDYVRAIDQCDQLVRVNQRRYWHSKYPFQLAHLDAFPSYFVVEDWMARYYFDEYENETGHINLAMFQDVDDGTRSDFSLFIRRAPER